jgi:type I restriction enzyme S subunit
LTDHLTRIADGSVQKNLNTKLVGSQHIIVPPTNLMNKYENIGSTILEKIRQNSQESRTLAELRDTLLPRLMSGQLRVP